MPAPTLNKTRAFLLPGIFLVLVLGVGLTLDPRELPSPLIGKPAPHFKLPQLHAPDKVFSANDSNGRVGIDYGSYGLPETYVIDKRGVIRYKQIGPVTPEIVKRKILPLIHELNRA